MTTDEPQRWKILVVEDDEAGRNMLTTLLTKRNYVVTAAADGKLGWEAFQREQPDLVITDIVMPVMNGIELLHRIREARPDTEVVLVTGFARTELVIEALRHGANNFVEKPFRTIELMTHLADSFRRLEMRDENRRLRDRIRELEEALSEGDGETSEEWY